jgi:signal transduction histidine kinase
MQARGAGPCIAGTGASAGGLEELLAVNQELQRKLAELESINNDLDNLLASSENATLCLDRDNRIKWFSPGASDVLGISRSDVGRPVSKLGSPLLGGSLIADAAKVLKSLTPGRTELESGAGRHYIRRTMPFRLADARVEGVIVTFTDITESKARTGQLRTLMFELAMAEERERREIAADLHDHLGQLLAVAGLKLGALTTGDEPAPHALREASELILQAKRAVGSLAFQISPPVLFELGLVPALEWLAEEMHRVYGIDVEVRDDGKPKPLDQTVRAIVFRAVRELLINVAKHAKVGRADVDVRRTATELVVSVTDNGVGFEVRPFEKPESGGGFGLPSLRERLGYIGGSLHIDSVPGDGTVATLSAPFEVKPRAPGKVSS